MKNGVVQDKLWLPGLLKLKYLIDTGLLRPHPLGPRRVRLLGVRRLPPALPAAELELPQGRGRQHHHRHVLPLALRDRQPVRRDRVAGGPGGDARPAAGRRAGPALRLHRRRRRLRHLRAPQRRARAVQFLLVRAGAPRRPADDPGRRHGGQRGGRACASAASSTTPFTPRPVWNPDIEQPIDFYAGWQEVPSNVAVRQRLQGPVGAVPQARGQRHAVPLDAAGRGQGRAVGRAGPAVLAGAPLGGRAGVGMDLPIPNPPSFDEAEMPPGLDERIRTGLCDCFPADRASVQPDQGVAWKPAAVQHRAGRSRPGAGPCGHRRADHCRRRLAAAGGRRAKCLRLAGVPRPGAFGPGVASGDGRGPPPRFRLRVALLRACAGAALHRHRLAGPRPAGDRPHRGGPPAAAARRERVPVLSAGGRGLSRRPDRSLRQRLVGWGDGHHCCAIGHRASSASGVGQGFPEPFSRQGIAIQDGRKYITIGTLAP